MLFSECQPRDELLVHIDPDSGVVRHFNASEAQRMAVACLEKGTAELMLGVALDMEFVDMVRHCRGIEEHRVKRLTEPYLSKPILGVWMDDGSMLTIDGHHRLVRRADEGMTTFDVIVFSEWAEFLITDAEGNAVLGVAESLARKQA